MTVVAGDDFDEPTFWNQVNNGSGTFIAGDNYGRIEALDSATKGMLAKANKEMPALGKLLTEALTTGVISPDAAAALSMAAHNINEDVAITLDRASRCINEDVARLLLHAADKINKGVARDLSDAARTFEQIDLAGLLGIAAQLNQTLTGAGTKIAALRAEAVRIGAAQPAPVASRLGFAEVKARAYVFLWGMLAGVATAVLLTRHFAKQ